MPPLIGNASLLFSRLPMSKRAFPTFPFVTTHLNIEVLVSVQMGQHSLAIKE